MPHALGEEVPQNAPGVQAPPPLLVLPPPEEVEEPLPEPPEEELEPLELEDEDELEELLPGAGQIGTASFLL